MRPALHGQRAASRRGTAHARRAPGRAGAEHAQCGRAGNPLGGGGSSASVAHAQRGRGGRSADSPRAPD